MTYRTLADYIKLIRAFLSNEIDVLTFERQYLEMFKSDETMRGDSRYEVLNNLFGAVDAFCADESLRGEYSIDEEQLREECREAIGKLEQFPPEG
jgi:hypothetical protein